MAHVLGSSVSAEKLLDDIPSNEDEQFLLNSLSEEYITLDHGYLKELHWVRSEHIAKILHEGYPELAKTALKTFDAIPLEDVSNFVKNSFCMVNLEKKNSWKVLSKKLRI